MVARQASPLRLNYQHRPHSLSPLQPPRPPPRTAPPQVRCIVRPRLSPADFLRDWGATTVQADLTDPSSLPAALVGVSTVIDCATARPEESTDKVRQRLGCR